MPRGGTYAPKKLIITWKNRVFTGFMDGQVLTVTAAEDSFTTVVGTDGEVSRTASANRAGEITIRLKQTSSTNDFLSQQLALDELTNANTGEFMAKDASGRTVIHAAEAWIKGWPEVVFSKEEEGREWVFASGEITRSLGGNGLL